MFIYRKEAGAPGEFDDIENMNADELRTFIQRALANSGLSTSRGPFAAMPFIHTTRCDR
jgi:hypothetical protein